jgi:hypothetical protein
MSRGFKPPADFRIKGRYHVRAITITKTVCSVGFRSQKERDKVRFLWKQSSPLQTNFIAVDRPDTIRSKPRQTF